MLTKKSFATLKASCNESNVWSKETWFFYKLRRNVVLCKVQRNVFLYKLLRNVVFYKLLRNVVLYKLQRNVVLDKLRKSQLFSDSFFKSFKKICQYLMTSLVPKPFRLPKKHLVP